MVEMKTVLAQLIRTAHFELAMHKDQVEQLDQIGQRLVGKEWIEDLGNNMEHVLDRLVFSGRFNHFDDLSLCFFKF